jgi:superoxide dismutase, Fe-Mn family
MKLYTAKKWDLASLQGISDDTLTIHFGLYEGYVKNTNLLNERIAELRAAGKNAGADPSYAELVRRLGWEYNGMVLHEYYFDNMTKSPKELASGKLFNALGESFGDVAAWKKDFAAVGAMRGIGWAIAYLDRSNGQITNHFVPEHEIGHPAGFEPIVVMDVWEHAWFRDYKPADRPKYIEAFLSNVDWAACEARLK